MLRLIIVDDNKYERNGILDSIEWHIFGIEVVGVFASGREALAHMDELQPHIVITDIAMPKMNGVEMSQRIRQTYPDVKIIFISCHSDFEFAKSAVDLGVYGYVLKPIVSDELEQALHKLLDEFTAQHRDEIEKERMLKQLEGMLPLVQEQFLKEVLLGNYRSKEDILKSIEFLTLPLIENANMSVISIKCNHSEVEGDREDRSAMDAYYLSYTIKSLISQATSPALAMYPVQIAGDDFAAIVFDRNYDKQNVIDAAVEMSTEMSSRLNLSVTMGISKHSRELTDLGVLFKQSQKAVNTRFYGGSSPIILFEEIVDRTDVSFEEMPSLESVYQDMKALISEGDAQDVERFIDYYLNSDSYGDNENYVKGFASLFVHIMSILLMETGVKDFFVDNILIFGKLNRMQTKEDVVLWMRQTLIATIDKLSDKSGTKNIKIIETIKDIIHNRYFEQITIEDISKSVFLSGRHINGMFKKETGKTVFDYLIQYRIDRAKQLLREDDCKVAIVGEAVGYPNTSYFILAFKRNVGLTPAEYKSKLALR